VAGLVAAARQVIVLGMSQRAALAEGARNHRFGKVHAKVEQVFRIVKRQFGYRKVRYRGIAKNGAPGVLAIGACKPVSRPQDTCVRLTRPDHPLPPAAVAGGFGQEKRSPKPQAIA
jgi:hypothetical protein